MTQPSLNQSVCGRVIVQTLSLNHNLRILLKKGFKRLWLDYYNCRRTNEKFKRLAS